DAMLDNGYVTSAEADAAKAEEIVVKPVTTSLYAPWFTFRVREQLVQVLGEKAAYRGGYDVFTSLDWNMQQLAEKEVRQHVDALKSSNVNTAALITMDPTTGAIIDPLPQLGINRDWERSRLGLSFGIGAGEMRLIDMASAYQVIANMGNRVEPTYILKIVDPSGKVVKDYSKPEGRQVLDQRY